jgi:low temperature requirement protein LtrA
MRFSTLRPPRLRTKSEEGERSATWLELFYDLVFVVAVAALGHRLLVDPSWKGGLAYIGFFIPLWWAWVGYTFYADRYDTDDLGQRNLAAAQIMAVAFMAASVGGETDSTFAFALAFIAARSILIIMYIRARRHVPETRELVTGYIKGHSIAIGVWTISLLAPEELRIVLWAIALASDFYTPYHFRTIQAKVPLDTSHLPERFGLFTILVLGESIAATIAGLSHEGWHVRPVIGSVLSVIIATGLWWIYFDNSEGSVVRRRKGQRKAWKPTVWIYSHLPLAIALTASGIGLEFVITDHWHMAERMVVTLGVAGAFVAMGLIHIATVAGSERYDELKARVRFGAAGIVVLLGLFAGDLAPNWFALLIAILVVAQVGLDVALEPQGEPAPEPDEGTPAEVTDAGNLAPGDDDLPDTD